MRRFVVAVFVVLGLALAGPAPVFADQSSSQDDPAELAREGMERLLRALTAFIDMIPQYEVPELLENGDIIIRRKHKPDEEESEPETDQTKT